VQLNGGFRRPSALMRARWLSREWFIVVSECRNGRGTPGQKKPISGSPGAGLSSQMAFVMLLGCRSRNCEPGPRKLRTHDVGASTRALRRQRMFGTHSGQAIPPYGRFPARWLLHLNWRITVSPRPGGPERVDLVLRSVLERGAEVGRSG